MDFVSSFRIYWGPQKGSKQRNLLKAYYNTLLLKRFALLSICNVYPSQAISLLRNHEIFRGKTVVWKKWNCKVQRQAVFNKTRANKKGARCWISTGARHQACSSGGGRSMDNYPEYGERFRAEPGINDSAERELRPALAEPVTDNWLNNLGYCAARGYEKLKAQDPRNVPICGNITARKFR